MGEGIAESAVDIVGIRNNTHELYCRSDFAPSAGGRATAQSQTDMQQYPCPCDVGCVIWSDFDREGACVSFLRHDSNEPALAGIARHSPSLLQIRLGFDLGLRGNLIELEEGW